MATKKSSSRPRARWDQRATWKVSDYHDTALWPEVRKLQTPVGMILAVVAPYPKHPVRGGLGTFFELQHGPHVYTGWCYYPTAAKVVMAPDKRFGEVVARRLQKYAYPRMTEVPRG